MTIDVDSPTTGPGPIEVVLASAVRGVSFIEGYVEHGDARGRTLGFPTANLTIADRPELDGVWVGRVVVEGVGAHDATISIGRRPTYYPEGAERLIEVHLLDFSGDLYGRHLSVELTSFLRHQAQCSSERELITLIASDVQATRERGAAARPAHHWPWLGLVPA